MKLTDDMCYEIIKTKDARFDGVFYTAVKTTGVYCRPVCKVPAPKKVNCRFYETAVEAEIAGFRPCLRCRPEMAPEYSEFNQSDLLIKLILKYFEEQNYGPLLITKSATHFGISTRHVHRLFRKELGINPQQYILTKRLLNAKRLLQDTSISVTEIADMSGFGSISRFYQTFKRQYGMTPKDLRRSGKDNMKKDWIEVKVYHRPPYQWKRMMDFFKESAIPKVEWVDQQNVYRRTLQFMENDHQYAGWIEVRPVEDENMIVLKISSSLEKAILQVIKKVRRTFDLDALPQALPEGITAGTRLPGCVDDGFELAIQAVISKQIPNEAATSLMGRLALQFGTKTETPWPQLQTFFPTPAQFISNEKDLRKALDESGITKSTSNTIINLAKAVMNKALSFEASTEVETFIIKMMKIEGIDLYTAQYIAMRALKWPDIFLVSDERIKQVQMRRLSGENEDELDYEVEAIKYAESYKPWRSYLTMAMWNDALFESNASAGGTTDEE